MPSELNEVNNNVTESTPAKQELLHCGDSSDELFSFPCIFSLLFQFQGSKVNNNCCSTNYTPCHRFRRVIADRLLTGSANVFSDKSRNIAKVTACLYMQFNFIN